MRFLEKNNILCPEQSGFRKHKSTIDSLTQLTSQIEKGFREKKHTIAVFYDLEKAYDTVWRAETLNSMHQMEIKTLFTLREMKTQLEWCKDTAPGPDDIMISMIKNLATPAKLTLLIAQ